MNLSSESLLRRKLSTGCSEASISHESTEKSSDMDARVKAAIAVMHQSLSDHLSIRTLAKNVNLSSTRLRQLFKQETSRSPMEYLGQLRLEKAAELLGRTFLSVKEVTSLCAIREASHFVRKFKKQYGLTPTEFRTVFWIVESRSATIHSGCN
jgi:transcriptional regulator GlxA family with amidase domain